MDEIGGGGGPFGVAGPPDEAGPAAFDPYTGVALTSASSPVAVGDRPWEAARAAGLEPPRYCVRCGRRMIVQIVPDGWWARCSRHGEVESGQYERRR